MRVDAHVGRLQRRNLGATRANLHTNKNRLQAATSTTGMYFPGMIDHQTPDFRNTTQDFIAASQKPSITDTLLSPIFASVLAGSREQESSDSGNASASSGHVTSAANQQSHPNEFASMEDGGGKIGPQPSGESVIYRQNRAEVPSSWHQSSTFYDHLYFEQWHWCCISTQIWWTGNILCCGCSCLYTSPILQRYRSHEECQAERRSSEKQNHI